MTCSRSRRATNAASRAVQVAIVSTLATAALLFAISPANATINNGENAIDILGEFSSPSSDTTANYTNGCPNNGPSSIGFNAPTGSAIDATNHWLFVADSGNNRVLVFTLTSGNIISSKTAAYVLGQADFSHCTANKGGSASQSSLSNPQGVAVDPTNHYLYVADQSNNRVMIFSTSSMSNGKNAAYEFGQPSGTAFTSTSANQGGSTSQSGLSAPIGVALDTTNHYLYVADSANNRVMIFSSSSLSNGETASYEFGQPSGTAFTTATAATSQSGLSLPQTVAVDATHHYLYVADGGNNRVMIFSTSSLSNGKNASYEFGQTSFTTNTNCGPYQGGFSSGSCGSIGGLAVDITNQRLFVADQNNNRVPIFSTSSLANDELTYTVLGQVSVCCTYNSSATSQSGLNNPASVTYDSTNNFAYVSDTNNNRVVIYNLATPPPVTSVAQSGYDTCAIMGGTNLYCWGLNQYGEDGLNNTSQYTTPVQVTYPVGTWTAISMGQYYSADPFNTCGIMSGGLYCWGHDNYGTAGQANNTEYNEPTQVTSPSTTWSSVSVSGADACAITTAGALYCWGFDAEGEDGPNATSNGYPAQVTGVSGTWTAVSQGEDTACGIASGKLYCWGYTPYILNTWYNANGNQPTTTTPQQIGSATNWTAVSTAYGTDACAINSSGQLYCWGKNVEGQDGQGYTGGTLSSPTQITSPSATWSSVSMSNADTCAITTAGALYCWGFNANGEDGLGNTTEYYATSPMQITSPSTTWSSVLQDTYDACAINTSGKLYCWGWNGKGEDGGGAGNAYDSPTAVTSLPTLASGEPASDEVGQYTAPGSTTTDNWTGAGYNNGPTALGLNFPTGVALDPVNHNFYVSDDSNNRVLVYTLNSDNSFSTSSGGHTASYVLGQTSLQGAIVKGNFPSGLTRPNDIAVDSTHHRLFVAEQDSTVDVFSTSSLSNGESASNCLGSVWGWGTTQSEMEYPTVVAYDSVNNRLFVSDTGASRVLIYNTSSITNGMNASYVLGQTNFTSNSANQGGSTAANTLSINSSQIASLAFDPVNERLFVGDQGNNRVLVFNVAPSYLSGAGGNGENASYVLGQTSFSGNGAATTQSGMNNPQGLAYDSNNNRLFVSDTFNCRVLAFNAGPGNISNGMSASFVLGASNFTSGCTGSLTQSTMSYPGLLWYDPGSGRLFVPNYTTNSNVGGNRVMIFEGTAMSTNRQSGYIWGYE
jgi:DNA-binding beta-propeller fold protein YncE